MTKFKLVFSIFILSFSASSQNFKIFNKGEKIKHYETNFQNFKLNIKMLYNHSYFKDIKFSLIETLSDSSKYKFYRNLLTGEKCLASNISIRNGQRGKSIINNKGKDGFLITKTKEISLKPIYCYKPYLTKTKIINDSTLIEIQKLLGQDFNLTNYDINKVLKHKDLPIATHSIEYEGCDNNSRKKETINYPASYFCSEQKLRKNLLDFLLKMRIKHQLLFNEKVHLFDVVFKLNFKYKDKVFTDYIVCSYKSKKIVCNFCFSRLD